MEDLIRPLDDITICCAAIKIAGSTYNLQELADVNRHTVMRVRSGYTKKLQTVTRDKLIRFINAK